MVYGAWLPEAPPPPSPMPRRLKGELQNAWRSFRKRRNMERPQHRNARTYHDHRFPMLTPQDIAERIARLGRILNRFDRVTVSLESEHVFPESTSPTVQGISEDTFV